MYALRNMVIISVNHYLVSGLTNKHGQCVLGRIL